MKEFEDLLKDKETFDPESQALLSSLSFEREEISTLNSMKQTAGWKLLDKKIREELRERITELIATDLKVQTLLSLLNVADTKKRGDILKAEIDKILPE